MNDDRVFRGLPKQAWEADVELLDRYTGFSSEIVRVGLLAMAGLGYAFSSLSAEVGSGDWLVRLLGASGLSLGLGVASALGHRYLATDGVAYHVAERRAEAAAQLQKQAEQRRGRRLAYRAATWALGAAVVFVAVGVLLVGAAFAVGGLVDGPSRDRAGATAVLGIAAVLLPLVLRAADRIRRERRSERDV